jgi:hypothetical protein
MKDPWGRFPDAPDDTLAMIDAESSPANQPAPAQGGFDQFPDQPVQGQPAPDDAAPEMIGGFADELPTQVQGKMQPEDEAAYSQLLRVADANTLATFLSSKGFNSDPGELQKYVDQRDQAKAAGKPVGYDVTYDLPKVEKASGFDAVANGATSVIPGRDAFVAGVSALYDQMHGSESTLGQDYNAHRDNLAAMSESDSASSPVLYHGAQLLGGLAIPVGLEGVALKAGSEALRVGKTMAEARTIASQAATAQMTKAGAIYGGLHGGLDGRTPGEVASGALVEGGLGALGGNLLGRAGGRLATPRAPAELTPGQIVGQSAQKLGMDVLPADVGGPTVRRFTAAGAQAPLSAQPIISAAQRVIEQGKGVRDSVAASVGSATNGENAGETARAGAQKYIKSSRGRIGRIYDTAANMAGDARVDLVKARSAMDEQIARMKEVPGGATGLKEAEGLRKSLDGTFTVQGVRDMRTEMFVEPALRGTPAERRLKMIVNAAADDVADSLNAQGKGNAARAYQTADRQWRERLVVMDRYLAPILGSEKMPKSGEDIVKGLERAASGDNRKLENFLKALPDDESRVVRASLIARMGNAKPGGQNADNDLFSLNTFLTHWNTMGDRAKAAVFGPEARASLNELANVAGGTKAASTYANHSNSSGGVMGNLAAWAGAAYASPVAAVLGAATQYGGGRLMASPGFARWLARPPRDISGALPYVEKLGRLARAEPAIANDVLQLQQQLQRAFSSTPMRAAAEQRDEELTGGQGNASEDQPQYESLQP